MVDNNSPPKHLEPIVSISVPVRWGEMDALGHLNNTVYFRLMEEARVHLLRALEPDKPQPAPVSSVIINTGCTFLRQVVHPETLRIDCFAGQPGNSSFMSWYRLYALSDPAEPVCTGYAKIVWIDPQTGRSAKLPDSVRQLLAS